MKWQSLGWVRCCFRDLGDKFSKQLVGVSYVLLEAKYALILSFKKEEKHFQYVN